MINVLNRTASTDHSSHAHANKTDWDAASNSLQKQHQHVTRIVEVVVVVADYNGGHDDDAEDNVDVNEQTNHSILLNWFVLKGASERERTQTLYTLMHSQYAR